MKRSSNLGLTCCIRFCTSSVNRLIKIQQSSWNSRETRNTYIFVCLHFQQDCWIIISSFTHIHKANTAWCQKYSHIKLAIFRKPISSYIYIFKKNWYVYHIRFIALDFYKKYQRQGKNNRMNSVFCSRPETPIPILTSSLLPFESFVQALWIETTSTKIPVLGKCVEISMVKLRYKRKWPR